MSVVIAYRGELLDTIERQAQLREEKANEEPHDARNVKVAAALRHLHEEVGALPDDSPELVQLAALWYSTADEDIRKTLAERAIEVLSVYRFGAMEASETDEDPASFLRHLAQEFKAVLGTR